MAVAREDDQTVITVRGALDVGFAADVLDIVARATADDPSRGVIIDVSHARDVETVGLAALLASHELLARVRLRGMSLHCERIVRHLTAKRH